MVSCFLTPSLESQYTYPPILRREIEQVVGEYLFDCENFRTEDKDDLLRQVYEMTDRRFAARRPPARVEAVGAVRDGRDGPRPDAPRLLEVHGSRAPQARAGRTRTRTRSSTTTSTSTGSSAACSQHADDDTAILVVSDHGAKRMDGGIRVNEWLRQEGLLATKTRAERHVQGRRRRHRLVAHRRLGRGRLLLPRLPQREGARARGRRGAGRVRARPRRPRTPARRDPGRAREPDPDRRATSPRTSTPRSTASRPT